MFGLELHPAVIHYLIALGVVGAATLVLYAMLRKPWLRWFGPVLLSLALAGAGAAYFSGQSAEDRAEEVGVPRAEIDRHEHGDLVDRRARPGDAPRLGDGRGPAGRVDRRAACGRRGGASSCGPPISEDGWSTSTARVRCRRRPSSRCRRRPRRPPRRSNTSSA